MQHSVQATIIAGDALNALQPVELHAVSFPNSNDSMVENQFSSQPQTTVSQYDRPFTPEFSSITSGGSSVTHTPLKDETRDHQSSIDISSIMTDSSFSSAVSTQSLDTEATPTNKSDATFSVSEKTPTALNGSIFTPDAVTTTEVTTSINSPSAITPQSSTTLNQQSTSNQQSTNKSFNHSDVDISTTSSTAIKTPSFKLFEGSKKIDSSTTNDKTPSREFNGSAFMQDCSDSLSDDDFGDFDTADGGFEELLT